MASQQAGAVWRLSKLDDLSYVRKDQAETSVLFELISKRYGRRSMLITAKHVVLQRLINASPADRASKALTALGRACKSLFILRYITEEPMRRAVQLQLNRGRPGTRWHAGCSSPTGLTP